MTFRVAGEAGVSSQTWRGDTVRARQRAALSALHQVAQLEAAGNPGGGEQRTWQQWGRAVADWLGLL